MKLDMDLSPLRSLLMSHRNEVRDIYITYIGSIQLGSKDET